MRGAHITAVVVLLVVGWAGELSRARRVERAQASDRARDAELPARRRDGYVGSSACAACHGEAHASWRASYHRTMTQAVGPDTVLASFDGRSLPHHDGVHVVERRGDEYWVRMPEANWLLDRSVDRAREVTPPMAWQRVVMSTGSHAMQLYWVPAEPGNRLVAFPFTWVVEARAWVANEATLLRPHAPDVAYSWNEVCLQCHAVAGAPHLGLAEGSARVDTAVGELGIACEACHGPGRAHVEARQNPVLRYLEHGTERAPTDIVDPRTLRGDASSQVCGQCHSVSVFEDHGNWLEHGSAFRPGDDLADAALVVRHPLRAELDWLGALLEEQPDYLAGRFWSDGMVRVSGREYNGHLESPCRADPQFGCLSCHELHGSEPVDQLRDVARDDDDRQCTQCHDDWPDVTRHTHHAAASSGSRCVNCHMPYTTFGLTKAIRSHQISSPSVAETLTVGRLNACNGCHLDRSLTWAARELLGGFGVPAPTAWSEGEPTRAAAAELLVRGDAGQRALAAWAMGWHDAQATSGRDWEAPLLLSALGDDYAAVRWVALRSLRGLPGFGDLDWSLAGALECRSLDDAAIGGLLRHWPGSSRDDAALYLRAGGFDDRAFAADRARRDLRVIDLRE